MVVILLAIESTRSAGRVLDWLFIVIFPNYNMGQGVGNLYTNYDYLELCLKKFPEDGFDMKPGKESLDEICDLIEKAGREFPCCKGTLHVYDCLLVIVNFFCCLCFNVK